MEDHVHPQCTELLPIPRAPGSLGEIFEAAVLRDMKSGAEGLQNRHYKARAVVLVLEVHGEAEYGDETGRVVPLRPGSCILVDPEIGHRYGPKEGSRWSEMYICFRGPVFDAIEHAARMRDHPVINLPGGRDWAAALRAVLPGPELNEPADLCNGRLIAFLTEAFPSVTAPLDPREHWISEAKHLLVRKNLSVLETTKRLAENTGIAAETLRKRFRRITGSSMKAWQLERRVDIACNLLERGLMPQKQIASMLGFSSTQHFSRCIRQLTGKTPGEIGAAGIAGAVKAQPPSPPRA